MSDMVDCAGAVVLDVMFGVDCSVYHDAGSRHYLLVQTQLLLEFVVLAQQLLYDLSFKSQLGR